MELGARGSTSGERKYGDLGSNLGEWVIDLTPKKGKEERSRAKLVVVSDLNMIK